MLADIGSRANRDRREGCLLLAGLGTTDGAGRVRRWQAPFAQTSSTNSTITPPTTPSVEAGTGARRKRIEQMLGLVTSPAGRTAKGVVYPTGRATRVRVGRRPAYRCGWPSRPTQFVPVWRRDGRTHRQQRRKRRSPIPRGNGRELLGCDHTRINHQMTRCHRFRSRI